MFKQATADDDPAHIRRINSDLLGFAYKIKNITESRNQDNVG